MINENYPEEGVDNPEHMRRSFRKELEKLINQFSIENGSDTPDFILAQYLANCLAIFDLAMREREKWYGRRMLYDSESTIDMEGQVVTKDQDIKRDLLENGNISSPMMEAENK